MLASAPMGRMENVRDISTVIDSAESARESCNDRTEPSLGELKCVTCSELRNCFTDVALLMNSSSTLISLAGFEQDGFSADAAEDAWLRRRLSGACHNMVLLTDYGINRQNREYRLQFGNQLALATQTRLLQGVTELWQKSL
jgi:hypothetical protein